MRSLPRALFRVLGTAGAALAILLGLAATKDGSFIAVAGRWSDRALTRHVKRAILATGFPARSFTAPGTPASTPQTSGATGGRRYGLYFEMAPADASKSLGT